MKFILHNIQSQTMEADALILWWTWNMFFDFFEKECFKFLPYILRFMIIKLLVPVYTTEITVRFCQRAFL